MAIRLNLSVGDSLGLEAINDRQFTIGGIFYDYGNPYGEVLLPLKLWQQYGFTDTPSSLGVSTDSTPDQLREKLNQTLKLPDNLMYDQAEIKQRAISIFSKTFAITTVLNSLTLLVAAVGLFSACFMLTQARAAPIARLYSLGVSRKQLTIMVITQMLGIVLLTCLVALPFGAILGYLLINHVTLQAFGWTIAMQWNWLNYVEVIATALVASFLAVGIPLYRQTRRPIMSSLQSEL
ncbi:ABC transporter permease [Vibrio sp. SCSIO 43137]|uniref:ABC transporter permease n=1 Tax=Vibrio sp. SCSIO 43137 TaxID=3021011 RepID=UPI00230800B6|nr:FtsX-like permease family protein [Vibrio sp. SCSIO 43137]WCE31777.1 FtsX-like permease family protein [Vibrio sp. SCSIO 43137]